MTVSVVVLFLLFFLKIIKHKFIIITIKLDHVSFVTEKNVHKIVHPIIIYSIIMSFNLFRNCWIFFCSLLSQQTLFMFSFSSTATSSLNDGWMDGWFKLKRDSFL